MTKFLLVGAFALVLGAAVPAFAADLAVKAPLAPAVVPFSWTGFYAGVNIGGHWDNDRITEAGDTVGLVPLGVNVAALNAALATTLHPSGFIGGGQVGYNWQTGMFVFGIEGDAQGMTGTASRTVTAFPGALVAAGDFANNSSNATFLATLRGRLGVTVLDRGLVYVTGGGAWGTVKTTDTFASGGGATLQTTSNSTSKGGWTVGGGFEYAFANRWSFKAEYLYVDLGNFNTTIPSSPIFLNTGFLVNHHYTENIARVGVNYRFGNGY